MASRPWCSHLWAPSCEAWDLVESAEVREMMIAQTDAAEGQIPCRRWRRASAWQARKMAVGATG